MLRNFLKGLEARQPQSVANMTIIPLVDQETEYNDIGTIRDIYLHQDRHYDNLEMGTHADYPTIMPSGYTLITKEMAQDRAVGSKTIIPPKKTMQVNAFCVQSSQPGLMRDRSKQEVRMLPASVRLAAYHNRKTRSYSALWNSLGAYNQSSGVGGNFLKSFFDKYTAQLNEFVAEFELVQHQRGAIIIINNEVMGVELSPNPRVWAGQWEPLIRDCYGSEAVARQEQFKVIDESALLTNVETLDDLVTKVEELDENEYKYAESVVDKILGQRAETSQTQREGDLTVQDVETDDFVGQAVYRDDRIIDLTLLKREVAQRGFRFDRRRV